MKRLMMTATCLAAVALAATSSPRAAAGDEEWATAGKILTGVVITHLLTNGLPYDATVSGSYTTVSSCRREIRTHAGGDSYWRSSSCRRLHRDSSRHPALRRPHHSGHSKWDIGPKHGSPACGAVIHQVDRHTRLYQPRVHDHPAFIQKRPFHGHPWVTVREHPSIW